MVKKPFQKDGLCSKTTGKVEILKKLKAEIETVYLCSIVQKINEHKIPSSMIINLDRAPTKFVPGCNKTLAKIVINQYQSLGQQISKWSLQHFPLHLLHFLPIQLIYCGNTKKSILAVSFPSYFVISTNKKQYSNEREALNMLENVIILYGEKQCVSLNLDFDHPAHLITNIFKGQMTCAVRELLNENHILLENVSTNLTYLFWASWCARRSKWLREAF